MDTLEFTIPYSPGSSTTPSVDGERGNDEQQKQPSQPQVADVAAVPRCDSVGDVAPPPPPTEPVPRVPPRRPPSSSNSSNGDDAESISIHEDIPVRNRAASISTCSNVPSVLLKLRDDVPSDDGGGSDGDAPYRPPAAAMQVHRHFLEDLDDGDAADAAKRPPAPTVVAPEMVSPAPIGTVASLIGNLVMCDRLVSDTAPILDVGSLLVLADGTSIGFIQAVVGAVTTCAYAVALDNPRNGHSDAQALAAIRDRLGEGTPAHVALDTQRVIFDPAELAGGGTDASTANDAPLGDCQRPDFSDDDDERQWKQTRKAQRAANGGKRGLGGDDESISSASDADVADGDGVDMVDETGVVVAAIQPRRKAPAAAAGVPPQFAGDARQPCPTIRGRQRVTPLAPVTYAPGITSVPRRVLERPADALAYAPPPRYPPRGETHVHPAAWGSTGRFAVQQPPQPPPAPVVPGLSQNWSYASAPPPHQYAQPAPPYVRSPQHAPAPPPPRYEQWAAPPRYDQTQSQPPPRYDLALPPPPRYEHAPPHYASAPAPPSYTRSEAYSPRHDEPLTTPSYVPAPHAAESPKRLRPMPPPLPPLSIYEREDEDSCSC
jgi:hypothetical protein